MHNYLPKIYYFIDELDVNIINHLNKKIAIIYRNYHKKPIIKDIRIFKNYCRKNNQRFFIANYADLAFKLKLDGAYIPSFNKDNKLKKYNHNKKFLLIGSAHNLKEIKIKEKQGISQIFLSPIFKIDKSKNYLGINKFNLLSRSTKLPIIALGGLTKHNIRKIKMTKSYGFASISLIKNCNKLSNLII